MFFATETSVSLAGAYEVSVQWRSLTVYDHLLLNCPTHFQEV